jgi:hypothetical protein
MANASAAEFAKPITRPSNLGVAEPTETEAAEKKARDNQVTKVIAKALGLKRSNILGYNDQTKVVVTDAGGKYQLSKNGKALRHLAGPKPPADIDLTVVVETFEVGSAAESNSARHAGTSAVDQSSALQARRESLEAELADVNKQLGVDDKKSESAPDKE